MSTRTPIYADAWYQYDGIDQWVVSLCDDDGEIRCVGGYADKDTAWTSACEEADALVYESPSIQARCLDGNGGATRRYTPDAVQS